MKTCNRITYAMLHVLSLILLATAMCHTAAGANKMQPWFRHYTTSHGLPANCVRDICQDDAGFIWMASDGGLTRFDGKTFRYYPLISPGPKADDQFALELLNSHGHLYVGTDAYLYRYDDSADRFVNVPVTDSNGNEVNGLIRSIGMDGSENLWVSILGKGVFRLNPDGTTPGYYSFPDLNVFAGNIYVDSHDRVWVSNNSGIGGLYVYNPDTDRFNEFIITTENGRYMVHSMAMAEDAAGNYWLGLWNGSLLRFDAATGQGRLFCGTGAYHIHSLLTDNPDEFLIGSDMGLTTFNPQTLESTTFKHDELNLQSLSDQFVHPLMRDREGALWVGTFYGGVNYMPPQIKPFNRYRASAYRNSVCGSLINAFAERPDRSVYIGAEDGGVSLFHPDTRTFEPISIPTQNSGLTLNVQSLCLDRNKLWIGTYANGLISLDTTTGRITPYTSDPDHPGTLDDNSAYALFLDNENNLWVATTNGLNRYNRADNNFERIRTLGVRTVSITADPQGALWLATHGRGVFRFHPHSDVWRNFRHEPQHQSLPHDHVNCITIGSDGTIWAATEGGLSRLNRATDNFEPVTLPNNAPTSIEGIAEEGDYLWLTTSSGLLRYNPKEGSMERFAEDDGLANNQFLPAAIMKSSDGSLYTGTISGFNHFHPAAIRANTFVPPVRFTALEIANNPVEVGAPQLPVSLGKGAQIRLRASDRSFSVYFSALSYANPRANNYRYKLDGFDKDWIETGNDNKAQYTNLPAGRYTLRVQASNNDGVWNPEEAQLDIIVSPPWYLSWWMVIFYVLLACGAAYGAYRIVIRNALKARGREIARLKADREKEMFNAKLSFFTIIAHEIRTPVSLIIGPLEKVMSSKEPIPDPVRRDLDVIDRNAHRLLSLVNQLLDFKKAEQAIIALDKRPTEIVKQVEAVAARFRPSIEQMGGTLQCSYPTEFKADIDPEAFNKMVSNVLNNARKYMRSQITLDVTNDAANGMFTIKVTDDGCGISPEFQQKIFKPFYQIAAEKPDATRIGTGLGLSILKNIVDAHHGTISVESEPDVFTSFIITLPLTQPDAVKTDIAASHETALSDLPPMHKPEGAKPRLLVVDDNEDMLQFLKSSFEETYDVVTATNGMEALSLLENHQISAIVSDLMMPKMNGVELCRAVRGNQSLSHIPFILLTAKTDNFSKIEGMNCGADYYVEKPFSTHFLDACLTNLMTRRKLLAQKFSQEPLAPPTALAATPVDETFITRLTTTIEDNFCNPNLNVDFLAEQMHMSRSSLYAKIKTLASMTPNELIQITRLKRAARMLREEHYMVSEVGTLVGFNSSSYFSKCFKAQFGMTPGEFAAPHPAATDTQTNP